MIEPPTLIPCFPEAARVQCPCNPWTTGATPTAFINFPGKCRTLDHSTTTALVGSHNLSSYSNRSASRPIIKFLMLRWAWARPSCLRSHHGRKLGFKLALEAPRPKLNPRVTFSRLLDFSLKSFGNCRWRELREMSRECGLGNTQWIPFQHFERIYNYCLPPLVINVAARRRHTENLAGEAWFVVIWRRTDSNRGRDMGFKPIKQVLAPQWHNHWVYSSSYLSNEY